MGWDNLRNGKLLSAAGLAGFQAFITIDKNLRHKQNPASLPIAVIVIMAETNRLETLLPYVPNVEEAIRTLIPGMLVDVNIS